MATRNIVICSAVRRRIDGSSDGDLKMYCIVENVQGGVLHRVVVRA